MIARLRGRPVLTCIAVLAVLAGVTAWDWHGRVRSWHRILQGYNIGVSMSVATALESLREDGLLDDAHVAATLERVVAQSQHALLFAALVKDGRVVARSPGAPDGLEVVPPSLARRDGDTLILWHATEPRVVPPLPPFGTPPPVFPPPPRPETIGSTHVPREGDGDHIHGVLAFGYDVGLRGARMRRELVDIATRLAILGVGATGLAIAFLAGRRSQRHASALEAERQRTRSLAEVGLTAAGLAHETRNPLGIIVGLAQQISKDEAVPRDHRVRAKQIIDAADRASSRLGEFMHYARLRDAALAPVDLAALVERTLEVLEPEAEAAGVLLERVLDVSRVKADEEMLQQMLINLVLNAIQASAKGGRVTVSARRSGAAASIEVADEGHGIDAELLPRVFEPYVTGRAEGHGLGLAIVRRLAELQRWTVGVASEPGRGARFTIDGVLEVSA